MWDFMVFRGCTKNVRFSNMTVKRKQGYNATVVGFRGPSTAPNAMAPKKPKKKKEVDELIGDDDGMDYHGDPGDGQEADNRAPRACSAFAIAEVLRK